MYLKEFIKLKLSQFVAEIYRGSVYISRSHFFPDCWPPFLLCSQASSLSNIPSIIMSTSCEPLLPTSASCLNQNKISRTRMLLLGIVFVLYCCFIQCIWLEKGLIRNLCTFPDLTFSFQFSYRFFIFCCIIINFFSQFLFSFKLQSLFHIKICLLVRIK